MNVLATSRVRVEVPRVNTLRCRVCLFPNDQRRHAILAFYLGRFVLDREWTLHHRHAKLCPVMNSLALLSVEAAFIKPSADLAFCTLSRFSRLRHHSISMICMRSGDTRLTIWPNRRALLAFNCWTHHLLTVHLHQLSVFLVIHNLRVCLRLDLKNAVISRQQHVGHTGSG